MRPNRIYLADCLALLRARRGAWHHRFGAVVTSPPYGSLQEYDGEEAVFRDHKKRYGARSNPGAKKRNRAAAVPTASELKKLRAVLVALGEIVHPEGSVWYNISDFPIVHDGAKMMYSFLCDVLQLVRSTDWRLVNIVVWHKRGAMPKLQGRELLSRDHEFVLHLRRWDATKPISKPVIRNGGLARLADGATLEECSTVWSIPQERVAGFPTPFPRALVRRCLSLSAVEGVPRLALDPYAGSCQIAAASECGWDWVAIELWKKTAERAARRLRAPIVLPKGI